MIELLFIFCWTGLFVAGFFLIWRRIISRIKVYLVMALNAVYLSGLFYLYPIVLEMSAKL